MLYEISPKIFTTFLVFISHKNVLPHGTYVKLKAFAKDESVNSFLMDDRNKIVSVHSKPGLPSIPAIQVNSDFCNQFKEWRCKSGSCIDYQNFGQLDTMTNIAEANSINQSMNTTVSSLHILGENAAKTTVSAINLSQALEDRVAALEQVNKKETKKSMFNFDFGKVTQDAIRFSTYGLAVKSIDGKYVSYDKNSHSLMDVEAMNVPSENFLWKMPVAIKDVSSGDVIVYNRVPMFVDTVNENTLTVVDIREGTRKEIYPVKNMFNFNYVTKIVSLIDFNTANADNPFGNMLPFLMMDNNSDDNSMLPFLMMNMNGGNMTANPMMMYFMMKENGGKSSDMLPFLMMGMTNSK